MKATLKSKQYGMNVWGVLGIVFGVLIVFWLAIKVAPEYMNSSTVQTCLENAYAAKPGQLAEIKPRFETCLQTNAIYDPQNYPLTLRGKTVETKWQAKLGIFGNMSLLLEFEAYAPAM